MTAQLHHKQIATLAMRLFPEAWNDRGYVGISQRCEQEEALRVTRRMRTVLTNDDNMKLLTEIVSLK